MLLALTKEPITSNVIGTYGSTISWIGGFCRNSARYDYFAIIIRKTQSALLMYDLHIILYLVAACHL